MIDLTLLHRLLRYEPDTGRLFWRARDASSGTKNLASWNTQHAGNETFLTVKDGYRYGEIGGRIYRAHRVIFAMIHGTWPEQVDHINGDRTDNRIENLRAVTSKQNAQNRALGAKNTSGVAGVFWNKARYRWTACIGVGGGVTKTLGHFKTLDAAATSRRAAEIEFGFHPNHGRDAEESSRPVPSVRKIGGPR